MRSDAMNEFYALAGISKSRSRPRVSNDNPYSESLFKTAKYVPLYPGSFETIDDARLWFSSFFAHYNFEHYHSGIGLLTPASVHNGTAAEIVEARQRVLDDAYSAHPERFRKGRPMADSPGARLDKQASERQPEGGRHSVVSQTICRIKVDIFRPFRPAMASHSSALSTSIETRRDHSMTRP